MSNHHRSSRSRPHHSNLNRSRNSHHQQHHQKQSNYSSHNSNRTGGGGGGGGGSGGGANSGGGDSGCDWTEHRSSSGKIYYYNTRTGVSQWEIPAELRAYQQQQQQPTQPTSPESEISESSSIRQQQDNCPSSSDSSRNSSESVLDDKPLLTPSLAQYFKPDLILNFNSSRIEELERQANQHSHDSLLLSERILKSSVDLKIAKAVVHYYGINIQAIEKKQETLQNTIEKFGMTDTRVS